MKVYLCGPINGLVGDEPKVWRNQAKEWLCFETLDPMRRDYRGRELDPGIAQEIVEGDIKDIAECDVLLVMFDKPSVGTSMEVRDAWRDGKHIVIVDQSGKPLSPWLIYHAHYITPSLRSACDYINASYGVHL